MPQSSSAARKRVEKVSSAAAIAITLHVNGEERKLKVAPWTTLLDALRDRLNLTGTKKGCDHGQCGACTVLIEGRRVNSCLALAVMKDGANITTIEGLAKDGALHPLQQAFIDHDAFQCGYCTPGQICSAIAMADEVKRGVPSAVTEDVAARNIDFTGEEIRERMSGNLCRCGAYNGIVEAVRETFAEEFAS
jgi:xanthine dehydrogenase YagT iron-sulfur-binding subunit